MCCGGRRKSSIPENAHSEPRKRDDPHFDKPGHISSHIVDVVRFSLLRLGDLGRADSAVVKDQNWRRRGAFRSQPPLLILRADGTHPALSLRVRRRVASNRSVRLRSAWSAHKSVSGDKTSPPLGERTHAPGREESPSWPDQAPCTQSDSHPVVRRSSRRGLKTWLDAHVLEVQASREQVGKSWVSAAVRQSSSTARGRWSV